MPAEIQSWGPVLEHAEKLFVELCSIRDTLKHQRRDADWGRARGPPPHGWLAELNDSALRTACLGAAIADEISELG
jgi:hypothetical protein